MTREPGRAPVRIRRHGAYAPCPHCLDQPPRPQGLPGFPASQGEDQPAARRLVSNVHHRIRVHRSVSFRPTHQTTARREELMRISCSATTSPRAPAAARRSSQCGRDTFGTPPRHSRDAAAGQGRDTRKQQKTLIRTNAPLVQVRLRGAREPRAEGVHRRSAKEAQIFPYLFAPSPLTLEGRSGNGSRSNPAEGPAARRAVSYP